MAEYRYYLIPDAMTRAFPEQFEKQTPTEFFDNIADLEKRYHQLREMPYNNERTWNERARFPYARLVVGIDRQNPDGAVAIIQVRNGVNYLCDDYRGPYADGSDAQIPQMAKKFVEVIGVDRVRPHTYTQRDGYTWVQVEKDVQRMDGEQTMLLFPVCGILRGVFYEKISRITFCAFTLYSNKSLCRRCCYCNGGGQ